MTSRLQCIALAAILATAICAIAAPITLVDTNIAGFVGMATQGPMDQPVYVGSYEEFAAVFGVSVTGLANPHLAPSVAGYFANGGVSLFVVRIAGIDDASIIGIDGGSIGSRTGLQALLDVDEISIIAVPGVSTQAVQLAMIAHCENADDRMAILDPDISADPNAVMAQRAGLICTGGHGALYFPRIQAAPAGESLLLPPSGFVAGSYSAHQAPDSPVGFIATATDVAYPVGPEENDLLNSQNINVIRDISGIRIWGARTLSSDPEWKYVSVRRMGLAIGESIAEGTQWCLQEDNTALLWGMLESDMAAFMTDLYSSGWFQGTTPDDAFFVRCDASTMTQNDIDEGLTIMLLGFAAVRPAEFIILRIVHQRVDISSVPERASALLSLPPPSPNPFNPATVLRFDLAKDTQINLLIFDISGRLVRKVLSDQPIAAGWHQYRWNGLDDGGLSVGSGVYLVMLEGGGETRSRRITLVR